MTDFAPPIDIPFARGITAIRGFGGFLQITRALPGTDQFEKHILDVERWTIRHEFRTVELPISGGFGAITRRRVASDFLFKASLSWDAMPDVPFLDDIFLGENTEQYAVAVLFALGRPSDYAHYFPGIPDQNSHYYCKAVQIDRLVVVTSTKPPDVIKLEVIGKGSAPLRRYVGPVWKGAGGLDFTKLEQKHAQPI